MYCRILSGLLTAAVLAASVVSCSLGRLIHEETVYECARIYLKDGSIISGRAVVPDIADKKVRFAPENDRKRTFDASETERLVVWKEKMPENKTAFFYRDFIPYGGKDSSRKKGPFWMFALGEGPNLTICMCGAYYSFAKEGYMETLSQPGEDIHIISFKNDGETRTIGYNSYSLTSMRSSLMKWLSDDPVLCGRLADRTVKPKDWERICDEYSPMAEAPVEQVAI